MRSPGDGDPLAPEVMRELDPSALDGNAGELRGVLAERAREVPGRERLHRRARGRARDRRGSSRRCASTRAPGHLALTTPHRWAQVHPCAVPEAAFRHREPDACGGEALRLLPVRPALDGRRMNRSGAHAMIEAFAANRRELRKFEIHKKLPYVDWWARRRPSAWHRRRDFYGIIVRRCRANASARSVLLWSG